MPDKLDIPIHEKATEDGDSKPKAAEQHIDPWDVQAAVDEQGNVLPFDYPAISKKWATKLIEYAG
jgi:tryptophanyl-tRNA synthetase